MNRPCDGLVDVSGRIPDFPGEITHGIGALGVRDANLMPRRAEFAGQRVADGAYSDDTAFLGEFLGFKD